MLQIKKNKKHIFLVDDDDSITQMLRIILESRGYQVTIACSGEEAIQKVESHFDIILLDLLLPDQDGLDICRKLKEIDKSFQIPIILLSAKMLSENIVEGLYLGADDCLTKPFECEELIARIEAVIRRSRSFQDRVMVDQGEKAIIQELRAIINEERIVTFFQPIVQFQPFRLIGFEALCRPKTRSMLANPELLFKAAIQFGFYHELEMLAWKKALEYAAGLITDEKLFLNCNPYFVEGPKFSMLGMLFERSKIKPENIVLEITERSAICDFNVFYDNLRQFRQYGFQFAVDDVGGGYASLESIVHIRPEVVKIDRHIINELNQDRFKRSIVKFIISFCQENNILSVAEGIENKEDLQTLKDLGVDAGQGYYLCKPTPQINFHEVNNIQYIAGLASSV